MYIKSLLFLAFLTPAYALQASSIRNLMIRKAPQYMIPKGQCTILHTTSQAHQNSFYLQNPLYLKKLSPSNQSQTARDEEATEKYMQKHPGRALFLAAFAVLLFSK